MHNSDEMHSAIDVCGEPALRRRCAGARDGGNFDFGIRLERIERREFKVDIKRGPKRESVQRSTTRSREAVQSRTVDFNDARRMRRSLGNAASARYASCDRWKRDLLRRHTDR
jgi:hypothetical protein